ncbi:MAG TPA: glycoside hydrolase family 3 C-terminal domain-containing protein [Pseudomonadales bacterium]|nr:glycoside hydrolase family 3 C-terminal domain-containing protein [Pseudomonadales bacterium]
MTTGRQAAKAVDEARIEALLASLSLDDKVAMAAGSGLWYSTPVAAAAIPAFKMSDGPNGVRGDSRTPGVTSTCFPVGIALGASWDRDLLAEVGAALAAEARAKGVDVLLGPTINLHRSPLAGRNFECYAEDPHLTAELAIAYTRGVQGGDVAVCLKHFVCNDSEYERHSISSEVDARTLHEVYLRPFERAIREAGAWTVMSAYNRLNGVYCSADPWLLTETLKGRWAFDGVVISDWTGTYDTVGPAVAGLDLEMPGPAQRMGEKLRAAVDAGAVDEAHLDDKVRRQLRLMLRTGRLDAPEHRVETSGDDPERRALARRAAIDGTVLLADDGGLLPLTAPARIALIGPNAVAPQIQGGGSSGVAPHEVITPAEGIASAFPAASLTVVRGCRAHRYLPLLDTSRCRVDADGDRAGLRVEFHAGLDLEGETVLTTHPRRSELIFFGNFNDAVPTEFSARIRTFLTPEVSGVHEFSLVSAGLARLFVAGVQVVDNWDGWQAGETYFGNGSVERIGSIALEAGVPVEVEAHFSRRRPAQADVAHSGAPGMAGVRIGMLAPESVDLLAEAEAAARAADVAIVVVGLNPEWETEGADRVDMRLPGDQEELVRRVAAVNPRTVVVLNAGSPIDVAALDDRVAALMQVWYPGMAFGAALGAMLSGSEEPGGRLPLTLPRRYEDNPAFLNYPGEAGVVRYGEGTLIGHRAYQARGWPVAFPFGHGLGYTRFVIDEVTAEAAGDGVRVTALLHNVGARAGATVVQVYCGAPGRAVRRAPRTLCDFRKVRLGAGERCAIEFEIPAARLAFFDVRADDFRVEAGPHRFDVGLSADAIHGSATVALAGGTA